MKRNAITALILTSLALGPAAFAGAKVVGNGGGGVRLGNGSIAVLDLVEAGAEQNPFFNPTIGENPIYSARIKAALANIPDVPVTLISRKLQEIAAYDRGLALALIEVMELYNWRMIDLSLVHICDEDTVLNIDPAMQVQLAARSEKSIRLDSQLWKQLDANNKTALILHEVVYALASTQLSADAREIVGYVFTQDMASKGRKRFSQIVAEILPKTKGVLREHADHQGFDFGPQIIFFRDDLNVFFGGAGDVHPGMSRREILAAASAFCQTEAGPISRFPSLIYLNSDFQFETLSLSFDTVDGKNYVSFQKGGGYGKSRGKAISPAGQNDCISGLVSKALAQMPQFNSFR